ncbi:uncharacterized protein [Paramisgurnus dabryanus]|uniref:uncharacterized protein isoform X2 n=1 Tax=Paramisgurnus dabryanus TaxID=90735 RepID=UPI0031F3C582
MCKENNRGPQMTTLHMIKPTKACWSKPLTRSQRKLVTQALSVCSTACGAARTDRRMTSKHCTKLNNPSLPCVLLSDTPLKIQQGSPNLSLEGRSTAEFSSYPDQTHLSKLIKVFMITRKSQVGVVNWKAFNENYRTLYTIPYSISRCLQCDTLYKNHGAGYRGRGQRCVLQGFSPVMTARDFVESTHRFYEAGGKVI